jgi:N6-adenosine-specific RNA methylase IME4
MTLPTLNARHRREGWEAWGNEVDEVAACEINSMA